MSVSEIHELWPGRSASDDINKKATLRRTWEVRTTDPNDDATVAIGDSSGIPRLGDPHPTYDVAFVVDVSANPHPNDPTLWEAVVTYSTELPTGSTSGSGGPSIGGTGGQGAESTGYDSSGNPTTKPDPQEREQNPINRPGIWTRDTEEVEVPFEMAYDVDGNRTVPVVNSAGLPYDPPLMTKKRIHVFGLTKNVSPTAISFDTILDYLDTVNNASWYSLNAGRVWLATFRTQARYENTVAYLECFLQFRYSRDGWNRYPIDRGFQELVEEFGSSSFVPILDNLGNALPEPSLLDGAGRLLAAGETAVIYPTTGYAEFPSSSFSDLMTLLGM